MLCGCRGIDGQYGVRRPMGNVVERGFYNARLFHLCLANLLASSFPMMFVWALTLRMVILWWESLSIIVIYIMRSVYGWLY